METKLGKHVNRRMHDRMWTEVIKNISQDDRTNGPKYAREWGHSYCQSTIHRISVTSVYSVISIEVHIRWTNTSPSRMFSPRFGTFGYHILRFALLHSLSSFASLPFGHYTATHVHPPYASLYSLHSYILVSISYASLSPYLCPFIPALPSIKVA